MTIVRRVLGVLMILTGLVGLAAGIVASVKLQPGAEKLERDVAAGMDSALDAMELISGTLQITVQTVDDTSLVLDSAVVSSEHAAETLANLEPTVNDLNDLISTQLPEDIQTIRDAMPALEQAATAIDSTLRTLAAFQWSATIPLINYNLGFGLGIDYDPETPLDQSIVAMDEALGELPEQLTGIQTSLETTGENVSDTAASVGEVAESLNTVSEDLHTVSDSLSDYFDLLDRSTASLQETRHTIRQQIRNTRIVVTILLVWLALSQATPLYLGFTLLLNGPEPHLGEAETPLR